MEKVVRAHRRDNQRGIVTLPRGMDGTACIDADENREQRKGYSAGGGDGDEGAMISGCDDGLR